MIETLFSDDNLMHLLEILFWLIGAFIIGLFFGYLIGKSKNVKATLSDISEPFETMNTEDDTSLIRAKKTFERGGIISDDFKNTAKQSAELDFKTIGIASEKNKDNLQKINGIGKTAEAKLNALGIFTYKQISNLKSTDIEKLTNMINFFPGRIAKDDWIGQAIKLMNAKEK